MKYAVIIIPFLTLAAGFAVAGMSGKSELQPVVSRSYLDTTDFDQDRALAMLREQIKGRETEPAALVFENIKTFERLPAGRLLNIMETGFSNSLGVTCTHCHNPNDWAGEEKPQKQIARDMMAMVGKINSELLSTIDNLESDRPIVNCTTCHRGEVKPALDLKHN